MKRSLFSTRLSLGLATSLLLTFSSCDKNKSSEEASPQEETQMATIATESNTEGDVASDDVFNNALGVDDEVGMAGLGVHGRTVTGGRITGCFTVTITQINANERFPLKVVTDFGTGCTGPNGHVRSGKTTTIYTGRLTTPGKTATTTFDNYKIDGVKLEGEHKITNTTASGSTQRQFTIDVTGGKLTRANGNYTAWNAHRVITQIEGNGTPLIPTDDWFRIEGSAEGKSQRENRLVAWKSEITIPLIKKFSCAWLVKGTVVSRREGIATGSKWEAKLNFGDNPNECDNKAVLTINGIDLTITLP